MQDLEARMEPLDVDERREPDRRMAVQLDRALACRRGEVRSELAHRRRRQQAAGILEVEAVHVRAVGERRRTLGVVRVRVHRR